MAITNDRFDTFRDPRDHREAMREQDAKYQQLIADMRGGKVLQPSERFWADPHFQKLLTMAIQQGETFRRDAEKLTIIKEVFGGK